MNQSTDTTIHYFQQHTRNTFSKTWLRFFTTILIFSALGLIFVYFFNIYFPSIIIAILSIIWLKLRLNRLRKMQDLESFKFPNRIWLAFKQRHPNIRQSSYPLIEEGFKDYLAIHLWRRGAYAMPSHSVDALWHILIEEFDDFYQSMSQRFLGYELIHKPHDLQATESQRAAQRQQLLNTWHGACALHGLNPQNTQVLPRIFQVDAHVRWERGLIFSLPFMMTMYSQMMSSTSDFPQASATSSCSSSSCSGSSSSSDSSHSNSTSSDSSSSCSSCSSCGGGGGD